MRTALLGATCLLSLCTSAFAGPVTKAETAELMVWQHRSVFEHDDGVAERKRIANHATHVQKQPNELRLKLKEKGWQAYPFTPVPDDSTAGSSYVFLAHVASKHGYLLAITYYEGFDYLWVDDRDGQVSKFCCGAPIFSPDGSRILVVGNTAEGDEAEYTRLFRIQGRRLVQEKKLDIPFTNAEIDFVKWQGDQIFLRPKANGGAEPPAFTLRVSTWTLD